MIGIWGIYASPFLVLIGIVMIAALLPMALWPLRWARVIGWRIPADNHLAIYYGRCLGAVAAAVGVFGIIAAQQPATLVFYYPFVLVLWLLMVAAHIWGAVKRIQPLTETLEIGFWGGLAVLTLLFWPAV